jgi:predicted RecB family nuclease
MATKITTDCVESYLKCKTKAHLKASGEQGVNSEYGLLHAEMESQTKRTMIEWVISRHQEATVLSDISVTTAELSRGSMFVVGATIEDDTFALALDGLKRTPGDSGLGEFHYVPVLFHEGAKIRLEERLLLAILGSVLGDLQGRQPETGIVYFGPECRGARIRMSERLRERARCILEDIKRLQAQSTPPKLMLNSHCPACEFRQHCHAEAVRQDDLSLLRGMSENEIRNQNRRGIFTVTQLSYTFRPRRKNKRAKDQVQPYHPALQALAIRERKTYVFAKPAIPDRPTRVYLDLEGDSEGTFVYLLGLLVVEKGIEQWHSFWADDPADEERLLLKLLQTLDGKNYSLFHFGSYERRFLERMRRTARDKTSVDQLLTNCCDILSIIRKHIYFPVYSNGLKDVGRHLGCVWTDSEASGVRSLVWRWKWERTRDDIYKQHLIAYNREDCSALRRITDHIEAISSNFDEGVGRKILDGLETVEQVKLGKPGTGFGKWGHPTFMIDDFNIINKCLYFDYQREKVVARVTERRPRPSPSRKKRVKQPRPNRRIIVRSNRCPECKSRRLSRCDQDRHTKLAFDLKVSEGGVKRIVIQFITARHCCLDCGKSFLPPRFKKQPRFLHALQSWAMYQHIANRTTFENLEGIFRECFGLTIRTPEFHRFKYELARRYRSTYASILKKIVSGNLLHADETGVRLKKEKGYVWAFTNLNNVFFVFKPSREGDFLAPMLVGFKGVLVSDFYAAYNSLPCPQQKCLVHLMRDINDDLLSEFHDEELKGLARCFGALLVKIVATIDKHGLQSRWLQKHKPDVQKFFSEACENPFKSEVAEKYRKRFLKYKDKLFTFLDYDGVPWNNNNAEHAVKHFARYRMISNGRMTANGLQPYLVLLSIYQTCVYKGVSFLRFLLSGEKDVDAFVQATSRSRRPSAPLLDSSEAMMKSPTQSPETKAAAGQTGLLMHDPGEIEAHARSSSAEGPHSDESV